jgi:hypothetical protein
MPIDQLVAWRMQEWGMDKQPRRLQVSVRRVLCELHPAALYLLKDPRFEVMVILKPDYSVWAYFPVHRRRWVAREYHPKRGTRVLLMFSISASDQTPRKLFEDQIRHHLGHVLLYLRAPKAWNDCDAACREWDESTRAFRIIQRPANARKNRRQ